MYQSSYWLHTERDQQVDRALAGRHASGSTVDAKLSQSLTHDVWQRDTMKHSKSGTRIAVDQDYCVRVPRCECDVHKLLFTTKNKDFCKILPNGMYIYMYVFNCVEYTRVDQCQRKFVVVCEA